MWFDFKSVLGKPEVFSLDGIYFKTRYKVKFKKPKIFNSDILDRFMYLGFEVERVGRYFITMLLPYHWWASKIKGKTLFYDHVGRVRIIRSDLNIEIVKRYNVMVADNPIKDLPYKSYIGIVMDYSSIKMVIPFDRDFRVNAIIDAKGDEDKLLMIYSNACHKYMNAKFPSWQVETMYWDDPVDEYVYEDE
jgi:hypothetical protein